MSEENKDKQDKKPDVRDLKPEKDPKGGGGFGPKGNPPQTPGGGTSTQPVPPEGS